MEKNSAVNLTLGEIVADDFRTASVFTGAGIDFCCGGKKTLGEACQEKGIALADMEARLEDVKNSENQGVHKYNEWDPGFLSDYIVNTHHRYVTKTLPELVFYTGKIASVHGSRHGELFRIADLFSEVNRELLQHLKNEEEVLFPALKDVLNTGSEKSGQIVKSEISRMWGEHEFAGGAMDTINQISNHYLVPDDGCSTYRTTYQLLKQFEDDLHVHVHLENNILFPKALKLCD